MRRRNERDRARRASETPEEREKRLSRRRERQRARRGSHSAEATETAEQREQRLSRRRDRERARRASHSAEARDTLLQTRRHRLDSETSEERQAPPAGSIALISTAQPVLPSLPSFVLRESFSFHFCKLNFIITNNHNYAAMTHTTSLHVYAATYSNLASLAPQMPSIPLVILLCFRREELNKVSSVY